MKKITVLCLTVLLIFLCSCSWEYRTVKYDTDRSIIVNKFNEVLSAIENKNKEDLISLFSKNSLKNAISIEQSIDELFEYFNGDVIHCSKPDAGSVEGSINNKKTIKVLKYFFDVKTTEDDYRFHIVHCSEDYKTADNVGVYSIYVIKEEDNIAGYYYEDNIPGITIDIIETSDNANLSVGGRFGYYGDNMAFCVGNKLMCSVTEDGETTVSELREFKAKTPREITLYHDDIYFKLVTGEPYYSQLYDFNTNGVARNTEIYENVAFYKHHGGSIYYTLSGEEDKKGVYKRDRCEAESVFLVEGDISEFVFKFSKMFYVEGNIIKTYDINKDTVEIFCETDNMQIYDLDIADGMLYYCTRSADGIKSYINQADISTGETEILYSDSYCAYLHTVRDNRLIFKTEKGYQHMSLDDGKVTPIFTDYDMSELYVYDDALFFNVIDGDSENWYRADIDTFDVNKIF